VAIYVGTAQWMHVKRMNAVESCEYTHTYAMLLGELLILFVFWCFKETSTTILKMVLSL